MFGASSELASVMEFGFYISLYIQTVLAAWDASDRRAVKRIKRDCYSQVALTCLNTVLCLILHLQSHQLSKSLLTLIGAVFLAE